MSPATAPCTLAYAAAKNGRYAPARRRVEGAGQRRHFRATLFCRLGNKFVERLGTDSEARKKAKAPQPLIRRLAARRDARRGLARGRRRFWVAGFL